MIRRPLKAAAVGEYYQWSSRGRSARRSCPYKPRGNVPYGLSRFAGFFAPWSDAVPRYVMDLFGGNRLLVSQAFDGSDDAEAVAKARAIFFGDAVNRPEITGYRLRNPFPGGDRIFHREDKRDYPEVNRQRRPSYAPLTVGECRGWRASPWVSRRSDK